MKALSIPIQMLGQSGCKLSFPDLTLYVDPYLSHSVQEVLDESLVRQVAIQVLPEDVVDANVVLITHEHMDHCDPHTLSKLAQASPQASFIGPKSVIDNLAEWGIEQSRLTIAVEDWMELTVKIRVRAIPAAHPEIVRDSKGHLLCVGYLIDYAGELIYLAGDTFARQEIIDTLNACGPINIAFLPVNEHNFFRSRIGIIGNMTVHEAFQFAQEINAKQVVAVHWDMFAINSVDPDEIRFIHSRMNPGFKLLMNPTYLSLGSTQASIIIRTLNESLHLETLLKSIEAQRVDSINYEVVLVDSGSTDGTLDIAERYGCRIQHITREEFSFGRSLNIGCQAAIGDILVIISGHCVPTDANWLQRICQPILGNQAEYVYGRQLGGSESYLSECRIFAKYFPSESCVPQQGFFCNNANSAIANKVWEQYQFNEELTGLEDMELAQRLQVNGGRVAYVGDAAVYHYHSESWVQIGRRFEREALALQKIMPQMHVDLIDTFRYITISVWKDWIFARNNKTLLVSLTDVFRYRWNQYLGSWRGNQQHRKLSYAEKEKYFYPR